MTDDLYLRNPLRATIAALVAGDIYSNTLETESDEENMEKTADIAVRLADKIIERLNRPTP